MKYDEVKSRQNGAVSLFIVLFTSLLLTIVTLSFIQLMTKDQQQATRSDLSQSAYDSAQAGVEDAKRLLLIGQACSNGTAASSIDCDTVQAAIASGACDSLARGGIVSSVDDETKIQQSAGDDALDQAYTCVKIATDTPNYLGSLDADQSILVPLRGAGAFTKLELSWFSQKDLTNGSPVVELPTPNGSSATLPPLADWSDSRPALMRAQLIQTAGSFKLTDFDDSADDGSSNANTLFLYPSAVGASEKEFAADIRYDSGNAPQQIRCEDNLSVGGYACKVTLTLPSPIGGDSASRNAYLRLSALYNGSHFSLKLLRDGGDVNFAGVQPEVDSTGRANDLFRRVVARVELKGSFNYPEAAVDIEGNLCKNFTITNDPGDYRNTCTP